MPTTVSERARESFRRGASAHFAQSPDTWIVRKAGERSWWIAIDGDDHLCLDRFTSRRAAEQALISGDHPFRRNWESTDAWYRGTTTDHRLRSLEPWEQEVVRELIS